MRSTLWLPFTILSLACGARSSLDDGASGGGGSGPTSGTTSTSTTGAQGSTSSGNTPSSCARLRLVEPVVVADTQGAARAERLALLPGGDVLATWLRGNALIGSQIAAFASWPPAPSSVAPFADDVTSYSLGATPSGVGGHIVFGSGLAWIADPVWPGVVATQVANVASGESLVMAGFDGVQLFAQADSFGGAGFFASSPAGYVLFEEPTVCTARPLAGFARVGAAIVGVAADASPVPFCDTGKAWPTRIVTTRYEQSPDFADPVRVTATGGQTFVEPLFNLVLTTTPTGAWAVHRTDGSTSRTPPPALATRVGGDARWATETTVIAMRDNVPLGSLDATAMNEALAVVYAVDPSGAQLEVRRTEADGTAGPTVVVPTSVPGYSGNLRLVSSLEGDALLLAWEGRDAQIGMARIDCDGS